MRKTLRIIAATSAIISAVSAIVLGIIYLEDFIKCVNEQKGGLKKLRDKFIAAREDELTEENA